MDKKNYLILAKNTAQMLLLDKALKENGVATDLVPAPTESGTVCAIAIKVSGDCLETSRQIIKNNNLGSVNIIEDKKLKLQGLLDRKLGKPVSQEFIDIIKKAEQGEDLDRNDIVYLLKTDKEKEIELLFYTADRVRKEMVGDVVEIRGAIEFSNYCRKNCKYCGVNSSNSSVHRYRMEEEEILGVVDYLHSIGLKTVILQSGEDMHWSTERLGALVTEIKLRTGMRVTLSVGEKTREEYEYLKKAGADNYLLKIETTNRDIFKEIHPDDDYDSRMQCSRWLKELGYINGSGNIIGLPGQTVEDIAGDILYFKEMGINMIGIGPFIPARGSKYENHPHGDAGLTLKTVAVTRIVCKRVYIPSTTALASLNKDAQVWALQSGANSIMLINTPEKYRSKYRIYDNKNMVDLKAAVYAANKAGRKLPAYLKSNRKLITDNCMNEKGSGYYEDRARFVGRKAN